jgi:hypothetical protein
MDFLAITKKAVTFVVAVGVSKIVHDIIENNVAAEKPHHKVAVPVASLAIGGVVADAASEYTDRTIDEIADFISEITKRNQNAKVIIVN